MLSHESSAIPLASSSYSLVTCAPRLSDHTLQLIDLPLRTAKRSKLCDRIMSANYPSISRPCCKIEGYPRTRFFANFLARLSLLFLKSSMTRRSYGASLSVPHSASAIHVHDENFQPPFLWWWWFFLFIFSFSIPSLFHAATLSW